MSDRELTKTERKRARAIVEAAWEAELSQELEDLAGLFGDWRKQHLNAHQLADAIHDFHDGPSRSLFSFYRTFPMPELAARAIAFRLVAPEAVPASLREALKESIQRWAERGDEIPQP